jgi:hypothetical protein
MRAANAARRATCGGATLVEVAVMFVIAGFLVQGVLAGQHLIHTARVHDIMAQQSEMQGAVLAFRDRFRALPGDYSLASSSIACVDAPCLNGNGNGRIEPGTGGALHEEILAWEHLCAAGFLRGDYRMLDPAASAPDQGNTPTSVFGGYLAIVYDNRWGYRGNASERHNIKTGNYVPAEVAAEVDRKIDDGMPGTGRFVFSAYAGAGSEPAPAGQPDACTSADAADATWLVSGDSDNCGGATLMY